jgi:UTP--glucose-1-phosphate uridylyltransferase
MAKIRKAVITAAGRGTRQYPATNTVQKELFPLVDVDGFTKPTLQIIVEEALASGIEEICIVANPGNVEAIKSHFQGLNTHQSLAFADKPWGLRLSEQLEEIRPRLTFVVQEQQGGYGHAVYQAKAFVGSDPFLVLLGDHIYLSNQTRCAKQVADRYDQFNDPVSSVSIVLEEKVGRYGIVATEPIPGSRIATRITRMVEKPTPEQARASLGSPMLEAGKYFAFFGIHALPPEVFGYLAYLIENDIRVKGEIQFTSAQEMLLKDASRYIALSIEGSRYDMGVPDGFIETQVALALFSPYAQSVHETIAAVKKQQQAALNNPN